MATVWAITGVSGLRSPGDIAASVLAVTGLTVLLRFILTAHRVTLDVVFASVCTYLIVGLVFGILFTQIAFYVPDAFLPSQPVRAAGDSSLFYFSFTVLTTLGLGDIAPASDAVRALTVLEAVIGQVFLIVLVARLVGVQIAQRQR